MIYYSWGEERAPERGKGNMKKEEIKKLLEKEIHYATPKCLTVKMIGGNEYTEWVLIDKTCKTIDALISMCNGSIYCVKYTSASMLSKLAKLREIKL